MLITNTKFEFLKSFDDMNHQIIFHGQSRGMGTSKRWKVFTVHGFTYEEVERFFILPQGTKKGFLKYDENLMNILGFREIPAIVSQNPNNKSLHINRSDSEKVFVIVNEYYHKDGSIYELQLNYREKMNQNVISIFESSTTGGGHEENLFIAEMTSAISMRFKANYHNTMFKLEHGKILAI